LEKWVERGPPPKLIACHRDKGVIERCRPAFPYPDVGSLFRQTRTYDFEMTPALFAALFGDSSSFRGRATLASAAPHPPDAPEPLSLANRIERMGPALTADELAEMLTVSRITIFKLAKTGRIPCFRIGTCVRFDPRAVATWLRKM
jgi:excisionase family DNA binding protein